MEDKNDLLIDTERLLMTGEKRQFNEKRSASSNIGQKQLKEGSTEVIIYFIIQQISTPCFPKINEQFSFGENFEINNLSNIIEPTKTVNII